MNHIYCLVWRDDRWVVAAENTRSRGKRSDSTGASAAGAAFRAFAAGAALTAASQALPALPPPSTMQLPTGGQVVAGNASISQAGAVMNVGQSTQRAVIDWKTFDVGSAATVNFVQPSVDSATLNRVLDSNPSRIFGKITAPGQVFLLNPQGVFFGKTASVDVGGLVASTHAISNDDFMAGRHRLERAGAAGSVENEGAITAADGGYVALLAPEVRNRGVVVARMGTVALAAGEAYDLKFEGSKTLVDIRVTPATIKTLIDNGNAARAPGGLIILSALAADQIQGGVVNNSGSLEAVGLVNHGGVIRLAASGSITHTGNITADAAPGSTGNGGTVTLIASLSNPNSKTVIDGSLSARAGDLGGDGGFIETSASQLHISEATRVTTLAPQGNAGTWLLDPYDITISSGLDTGTTSTDPISFTANANDAVVNATSLEKALVNSNVTVTTGGVGSPGTQQGDINVNAPVSWSANKLTLSAHNNININANLTASGSAKLALEYGQGKTTTDTTNTSTYRIRPGIQVSLPPGPASIFSTKLGSDGVTKDYTVITSLGLAGSMTPAD
ncbi:MAG: filamentous hemagglutinin N-terminal domain-containing protein, partial [Steroidobacteraceae bacterium]